MLRVLVLALVILLKSSDAEYNVSSRPNIIFFLVDDMGWNDVGYHGMTEIPTPNIDALAYNSIILNNYYTHPACSPSRSALLSGMYATSTGLQHIVIKDPQRVGLPLELKTLPEHMKRLGYTTRMLGKWHQGFYKKEYTPLYRGFDSHFGFWQGDTDLFYHITVGNYTRDRLYGIPCYETRNWMFLSGLSSRDGFRKVNKPGEYLTYLYTHNAVRIIKNHDKSKPLFLYLAHHGVHRGNSFLPIRAPKPLTELFTTINNSSRKNFAGALTAIDQSLGDIMEALENKKILENTIIVFSSDNGSPLPGAEYNGGSNYPLRSGKLTGWEGGVRTNAFVWSSQFLNRGMKYDGLMHIVDWLPTLYSAAGGKRNLTEEFNLDGMSMWDAIVHNETSPRRNAVLQIDPIDNYTVYRSGDFKIVLGEIPPRLYSNGYYGFPGRRAPPPTFSKTDSKTEIVLKNLLGENDYLTGKPIEVNCGNRSNVLKCNPSKEVCLFNITEDPCEFRNLAKENPEIVEELLKELHQIKTVSPNYPMEDYGSSPDFYNGYWSTWNDFNINYNSTSC